MSAVIRRLRPATSVRLALGYVRSSASHKLLVVGIAVLCVASVILSLTAQNDVPTGDSLTDVGGLIKDSSVAASGTGVDGGSAAVGLPPQNDRPPSPLFQDRPLVLLTLSYHAAPIYDLMDQLQPLGVQFIERGINAYACRYFNTCRQDGLLEVGSRSILFTYFLLSVQYSA